MRIIFGICALFASSITHANQAKLSKDGMYMLIQNIPIKQAPSKVCCDITLDSLYNGNLLTRIF